MYPCIEAIEWRDGRAERLEYHQNRINIAFGSLYPAVSPFSLSAELAGLRSGESPNPGSVASGLTDSDKAFFPEKGRFKLRLKYDYKLRSVEFLEYKLRTVNSLRLIAIQHETMLYKQSDRRIIDAAFAQRGDCDDVLLTRNGMIADTSYANIALFDGHHWKSPRIPLLYGTRRAFLLDQKIIQPEDIHVDDLSRFTLLRMFNALIDFGALELPLSHLRR